MDTKLIMHHVILEYCALNQVTVESRAEAAWASSSRFAAQLDDLKTKMRRLRPVLLGGINSGDPIVAQVCNAVYSRLGPILVGDKCREYYEQKAMLYVIQYPYHIFDIFLNH